MPRKKQPKALDFEKLEMPEPEATSKRAGSKRTPISKAALREMFETVNAGFHLSGYGQYALVDVELDSLADSWHDVLKLYPSVGRVFAEGNVLTVWGKAIFTTVIIAERRRGLFAQSAAGTTWNPGGDDGQRKDDASASTHVGPTVLHRDRQQA